MMKINFYLIFAAICIDTSYTIHATQAPLVQPQRKATPLELRMIEQASNGTLNNLKKYLKEGANINAKNDSGYTVLMAATANGSIVLVQNLLDAGADINAKDKWGATALRIAVEKRYINIVKKFIAAGADINVKDNRGFTALMEAVRYSPDVINELIAAGADINAKNNHGNTALILTTWGSNNMTTVQQLIAAGADDTIQNDLKHTARDYAKDPAAYDKAVAAGLAVWQKKLAEYRERQAEAKRLIEEQRQLIPGISDIIGSYAYGQLSPDNLPEEEEKKVVENTTTSSALGSKK